MDHEDITALTLLRQFAAYIYMLDYLISIFTKSTLRYSTDSYLFWLLESSHLLSSFTRFINVPDWLSRGTYKIGIHLIKLMFSFQTIPCPPNVIWVLFFVISEYLLRFQKICLSLPGPHDCAVLFLLHHYLIPDEYFSADLWNRTVLKIKLHT